MKQILTPNTMTFLGGLVSILVGHYVLKGSDAGTGLVFGGVAAMGMALRSPGDHIAAVKAKAEAKRQSSAPPAP